ncbi:MAG TPA: trehalose-6-phosphate synthase [Candidatus Limnocylindrales bacterium]|nr:trehalose-6-phosphate synthase [Candidatus Limnocylindrales bacterium]
MPNPMSALLDGLLPDNARLFVVSNRGPVTFESAPGAGHGADLDDGRDGVFDPKHLTASRGSGGLVTALAEVGRYAPITWIATASTDGDRVAGPELRRTHKPLRAIPEAARPVATRVRELLEDQLPGQDVRLDYVDLPRDVYGRFYETVSNPFLWFLQHQMYALPYGPNVDGELLDAWRNGYRPANRALAEAVVAASKDVERPIVLLQDYHLYLAAANIRELRPDATILHFNHIPWPPASIWQMLPQGIRRAICEGLLGADIVGLQTDRYADQFLDTVASFVRDARVDRDGRSIRWHDRRIRVATYPISIDPDGLARFARSDGVADRLERLESRLERAGDPRVIVRADRIEPSKNALRGFLAFEEMLRRHPELRSQVRFVAVHAPTRTSISEYVEYAAAVREVVARVNGLAEPDDQPIWIYDGSDYAMAIAAMRRADVLLVNPIVDGMNLVAKEAVLVGERLPVLVLSETAGAAEQLASDSLSVAPADVAGTADQLERALTMPVEERRHRLRRLRSAVREQDLAWWLRRQLRDIAAVRSGALAPSRRLRDTVRRVEAEPA